LHHWSFDQASHQWIDGKIFGPLDAAGNPGFIQSDNNTPGDFEVVCKTKDGRLTHWTRHNGHPWKKLPGTWFEKSRFGNNVAFSGPSLIQSRRIAGAPQLELGQGPLEVVCVLRSGQMQHWTRVSSGNWTLTETFGSGVTGCPCMIQGQFGAANEKQSGNFELCVESKGKVQYWSRDNGGNGKWAQVDTFGNDIREVVGLLQGSFGLNLEVIVITTSNMLQHWWRDNNGWHMSVVIGTA
jgi:hypothetical protein